MASTRQKLETRGVIMALLSLVLMNISCEDKIDSPAVDPSEGKMVEVSLNIGFTEKEDGYALDTKSGASSDKGAFSCELQPTAITKGDASVKPDKLYKLEIQQYDQSGNRIGGMESKDVKDYDIGSALTVSLKADNNCQLVVVAWGENATTPRLGTSALKDVQKLFIDASDINSIPTNNMNKMPYVLHLRHVKVESTTIKSIDGHDVRLLLKRLATRLTINWTYGVKDFTLNQIILRSIPLNYNVVAVPDENETYPSLLDQYTSIQLTPEEIGKNTYSCWIPANVRGFNTASNSPLYRIKANAPTGSAYATFIAKSSSIDSKEKLDYRIYLGGKDYSDFNLYGNTDYSYTVNFNHEGIPVNDRRVSYINPIPASDNNENFVKTANCFMVAPGGAFCFNPYNYFVNGKEKEGGNDLLREWCASSKIQSVKVLWQTLENGDLGDPVLGTVNSSDDHDNIVDIKNGNDFEAARIYCRVAPNTTGGSGVIAAYSGKNGTGDILWSWHIWVTDYSPDATLDETVLEPANKRILKFTIDNANQRPMMDRNLGANAGYIDKAPAQEIDRSKANGFHYQWGRKDLYPSSYTNNKDQVLIKVTSETEPTPGVMSLYAPDGITFTPFSINDAPVTRKVAYGHPLIMYMPKDENNNKYWLSNRTEEDAKSWLNKAIHDPCPVGWRVPLGSEYRNLIGNVANKSNEREDGGALIYFDSTREHSTYVRFNGYWRYNKELNYIGQIAMIWGGDNTKRGGSGLDFSKGQDAAYFRADYIPNNASLSIVENGHEAAALGLRCIQDRE